MRWQKYIILLYIPLITGQIPKIFTDHGLFTSNSCPTRDCTRCGVGLFKENCGGLNSGQCSECTGLPLNAVWTTDGRFTDSCEFECKPAYTLTDGLCVVKPDSIYTVEISISLPLSSTGVNAVKESIIQSFATLANCGTCETTIANPVVCQQCKLYITVQQTAARRLLAPTSTVSIKIEQLSGSSQATATAAALTVSNINTQFASSSIPNCAVVSSAAVVVTPARRTISPTPAPQASSSSLSTGAIVGIVIAVVVLLVGVAVGVCIFSLKGGETPNSNGSASASASGMNTKPSTKSNAATQHTSTERMLRLESATDIRIPARAVLVVARHPIQSSQYHLQH